MTSFESSQYVVDDFSDANDLFLSNGWTDGFPIIPPTSERVEAFLAAANLTHDAVLGEYHTRSRLITAEKLAINAVMAGCLPNYFPVVIAIVRAMLAPEFDLHIVNSSTGSPALGYIVNGPIRRELNMNLWGNMLGPGNHANATIGRSIRLIQLNVMGSVAGAGSPGDTESSPALDRSVIGSPAKYTTYHIVENEEDFPSWSPTHVERGFGAEESAVTVFAAWSHVMMSCNVEETPDEWIDSVAQYIVGTGRPGGLFGALLVPTEAARLFVAHHWTKTDVRQALFERTSRTVSWMGANWKSWIREYGWKYTYGGGGEHGGDGIADNSDPTLTYASSADEIFIVPCGGPAGNFPAFVSPFSLRSYPITKLIE